MSAAMDSETTGEPSSVDPTLSNITKTENNSYTFSSTTDACLDFYVEVLQGTDRTHLISSITKAWEENPLLAVKLIFQLRDIRNGKGAIKEFHYCLIWMFYQHPLTLIHNLEYVPQHGYWKDLSWLIKFLLNDEVCISTGPQESQRTGYNDYETEVTYLLDELIRKRVDGIVGKRVWKRYLDNLSSNEAKKHAQERFQELSKIIHLERRNEAKLKRNGAKTIAKEKMSNFQKNHKHFSALYEKVINLFVSSLIRDKNFLLNDKSLPKTSLVGKWAPTIGNSIDFHTSLAKNIARALYLSTGHDDIKDHSEDFDKKAFIHYRKEFLTPLRAKIVVPEKCMSKRKWSEIEYERVPSVCMKRNKKHFLNKDHDRFNAFIEEAKSGIKKIASGALLPHEIVAQFVNEEHKELKTVVELQWNSYVENLQKSGIFKNALSVCDVSGSMNGDPMNVAIALSLLTAALSQPPFNNFICSFSATPSLHKVNQPTLEEKVLSLKQMEWGMNTNLQVYFSTHSYKLGL